MEASYTPGDGVLVGAGRRWLLLGADPEAPVVRQLFALLTGPRVEPTVVLDVVDTACGAETPLALVDLTTGAETSLTRGGAVHTTLDGAHTLALAPATPTPDRPLVGGAVAAAALVVRPAASVAVLAAQAVPPKPVPAPVPGLIDAVPPEILSASAPERTALPLPPPSAPPFSPPPPASPVPVATDEPPDDSARRMVERMGSTRRRSAGHEGPGSHESAGSADPDHDGQTTYRPETAAPLVEPGAHLKQTTAETVLAVHCRAGHVTAAFSPRCRVCHEPVPEQEPHRMPRPLLGVLHLPDGERVPLDRGVVLGRQPDAAPGGSDWPHLVRLPAEATYVSRSHLSVELDGWLVIATDLGSRGGTTLRVPGRPPQRIRGHEQYVWEPGQVLDLADSYEIVYEVSG